MNMPVSRTKPFLSIILPVLDEQERINSAVELILRSCSDASVEIIVVDGDLRGETIRRIRRPGVITAIAEKGRAHQMNRGAELASGKILLFLHADTVLPDDALSRIAEAMSDERLQAGAFDLGIDSMRAVFRITEQYVRLRTRLTRIPFGDQAIFIRRDYFCRIGGYRTIALMEDVELMRRIKKRGDRICIIPEKVTTSARRWEREGILFCTIRNWALQIAYLLGVSPDRLKRWYQ